MVDRIVIVGASPASASFANRLARVAPVLVLDPSPSALEALSVERGDEEWSARHSITRRMGDGTSRLVLADVRGAAGEAVALVAAAVEDRQNLETCRLGKELGFEPRIALAIEPKAAAEYEALDARPIVQADLLGKAVEQALELGAITMATAVGSGTGDILEFRVLPSSPAVGVPLAELHAEGWRIAAIYRDDVLVLPTGKTKIQSEDRIIVVGDPRVLLHVAESLRVGVPTFPLLHGPHIVTFMPAGSDPAVEQEAAMLVRRTRATRLVRLFPRAAPEKSALPGEAEAKSVESAALPEGPLARQLEAVSNARPGLLVLRAEPRRASDALLGRGGPSAVLCDRIDAPVLFASGATEYSRVSYAALEGAFDFQAAEMAIDLARLFAVPLHLVRVDVPSYLGAASGALDRHLEALDRRVRLHQLTPKLERLEGNPIRRLRELAQPGTLLVLSRRHGQRDRFTDPDAALRIARRARGSVLVHTVEPA